MTDYNLFPPIRFRFHGDVEQAKGRIPQARTQMAQLIRRMEGFGRDSGQWQGEMSDGTKFRIAKIGDVHVADIFGVAPPVEPALLPVMVPYAADGQREDVVIPMAANPDVVIPEAAIPEIPKPPHIPQREILMRPHGEAFGGDGYLWAGARVLLPDFDPETHPHVAVLPQGAEYAVDFLEGYLWSLLPESERDKWQYYTTDASVLGLPIGAYQKTTISNTSEEAIKIPIKPIANMVLFEPDFGGSENPSVMQSLSVFVTTDENRAPNSYYQALFEAEARYEYRYLSQGPALVPSYGNPYGLFGTDAVLSYANTEVIDDVRVVVPPPIAASIPVALLSQAFPPTPWVPASFSGDVQVDDGEETIYFAHTVGWTDNGSYTTAPGVYKRGDPIDVHGYIAVSVQEPDKDQMFSFGRSDLYSLSQSYSTTYETADGEYSLAAIKQISFSISGVNPQVKSTRSQFIPGGQYFVRTPPGAIAPWATVPLEDSVHVNIISGATFGPDYQVLHTTWDSGAVTYTVNRTDTVLTEEDADVTYDEPIELEAKSLAGIYELRLSAGWASFPDTDHWDNTPVQVEVYIELGGELSTFTVEVKMANYSENQGVFKAGSWQASQEPTPFDEFWYPGCWLIDIKNKTIIQETRPDKLDRPWFI